MNDYLVLLLFPGLPILMITFAPFLNGDKALGHVWVQCLLLFCGVMLGPIMCGIWGIAGSMVHLTGVCFPFSHSIWAHIIPIMVGVSIVLLILNPLLKKYNGREF